MTMTITPAIGAPRVGPGSGARAEHVGRAVRTTGADFGPPVLNHRDAPWPRLRYLAFAVSTLLAAFVLSPSLALAQEAAPAPAPSAAAPSAPTPSAPAAVEEEPLQIENPLLRGLVGATIDEYIIPAFAELSAETAVLQNSIAGYCYSPNDQLFQYVTNDFSAVAAAWGHVLALQIEPLTTNARRERFFFWPDPRGITLRQIQPLIAERDETATDPATLAGKSVALQGLGALEFILFGTGADSIRAGTEEGLYRCRYARAIAANLVAIAEELVAETGLDAAFTRAFLEPGLENPLYRTNAEAAAEILMSAIAALDTATDNIVEMAMGDTAEEARPRSAPLWRSGQTLSFLAAILDGAQELLAVPEMRLALPNPSEAWLPGQINLEFGNAINALPASGTPIDVAVTDPALRQRLDLFILIADNIRLMVGLNLPEQLGVLIGFNARDRD